MDLFLRKLRYQPQTKLTKKHIVIGHNRRQLWIPKLCGEFRTLHLVLVLLSPPYNPPEDCVYIQAGLQVIVLFSAVIIIEKEILDLDFFRTSFTSEELREGKNCGRNIDYDRPSIVSDECLFHELHKQCYIGHSMFIFLPRESQGILWSMPWDKIWLGIFRASKQASVVRYAMVCTVVFLFFTRTHKQKYI